MMPEQYLGEIRMFAGNFAPRDWALCDGRILQIFAYEELYDLIGTTYGGNGVTTFALPDLRGRIPIQHSAPWDPEGKGFKLGAVGGVEEVTLAYNQIPPHTHTPAGQRGRGSQPGPKGGLWAQSDQKQFTTETGDLIRMPVNAIGPAGTSQPHTNLMPYLCVNFIIALHGAYPPRP